MNVSRFGQSHTPRVSLRGCRAGPERRRQDGRPDEERLSAARGPAGGWFHGHRGPLPGHRRHRDSFGKRHSPGRQFHAPPGHRCLHRRHVPRNDAGRQERRRHVQRPAGTAHDRATRVEPEPRDHQPQGNPRRGRRAARSAGDPAGSRESPAARPGPAGPRVRAAAGSPGRRAAAEDGNGRSPDRSRRSGAGARKVSP